jgi:nucleosome binding factor SPN SPT16 subunit
MSGLSEKWFRANSARVIDLGEAREKRKKTEREGEDEEQERIREAVLARASEVFPPNVAAYSAAYVAVKERLLGLGFSTGYADKAAKLIALDYEGGHDEPTFW